MSARMVLVNHKVINASGVLGLPEIDAIFAKLDAAGFVIVPKEPTDAMQRAGLHALDERGLGDCNCDQNEVYAAMLAATQQADGGERDG